MRSHLARSLPRRALAGLASLLLLASACSAQTKPPEAGEPPSSRPTSKASPRPSNGTQARPTTASSPSPGTTATPARPGETIRTTPRAVAYHDDGPVGAMARTYLRSSPATRLRVEVDYVDRFRAPSPEALEHVESILRRESAKPEGVEVVRGERLPNERDEYSLDDIRRLERRYRDARSSGNTATIWVVYLNGTFAQQEGALGVAYSASAAAIFWDQINGAATSLVTSVAIERSVLTHEIGHLLGLVNIGYTSRHDHEDANHPGHSSKKRSVMYWAIEDVSIASLLGNGPPDDFDQYDRDDLRMLRNQ